MAKLTDLLFGLGAFGTPIIIMTGLMVIIINPFLTVIGMIISSICGISLALFMKDQTTQPQVRTDT